MYCRFTIARFTLLSLLAIGLLSTAAARGDLVGPGHRGHPHHRPGPPPVQAPVAVPMKIRVDRQATESVLTIPKKLVNGLAVDFDKPKNDSESGRGRAAIAGFAMSLAFFGAFFVRRSRKARALVVGIICVGAIAAAGTLLADIARPMRPAENANRGVPLTLHLRGTVEGNVVVRLADQGDEVTLTLAGARQADNVRPAPRRDGNSTAPAPVAPAAPPAPMAPMAVPEPPAPRAPAPRAPAPEAPAPS